MNTSITELFGIKYPILNAGMGRVAFPNMVAAVSNAGGLGVLGAGSGDPRQTREYIREIRSLTDKPFGINAPLALPNGRENAIVALEEKVPVINYSMGKGDWIVKTAHKYGGKVMASVNDVKLAQRAEAHGCDAVIAAGHEAAGHAGEIGTFVLVPRLAEVLKIPVIAAGGIANGDGLVAALALGAGGVSMGTRFWTTKEGPMHQNWKNKALELDVQDTLFSPRFDGIPCRQMKTAASERMMNTKMLNVWEIFLNSFAIARELNIPWPTLVKQTLSLGPRQIESMMRMSKMMQMHTITMTTGDLDKGMTASGQSVGLIHDLPSIAEVMERLVAEAESAQRRLAVQISESGTVKCGRVVRAAG
ncbi:NAD(P)H-dependent flavin oxidoreductase [Aromatoleum petrolei]|uniref:NAD(P)H-dependent flavin oxidoreductase n=1 Tax=Aromatoleum petrolei TaxID=76116 RepID=UPI001AEBDBB3|nr:nitronate monooxygenase [Aromatoleum petrolei]QTQ34712.1 Nitronate monooxygenase domain-containing protein [Aromatoleum petrolei]